MSIDGIIFDFDGVLIESEYVGNEQIAWTLTELGYPTTVDQSLDCFTGLGGRDFFEAVERHIGGPIPEAFTEARAIEDARALADGVDAVVGAVAFVRSLPKDLPRAIASSSTTHWIRTHLDHLGLRASFEPHIYSGREHVTRGKPAPDVYLHAAAMLDVDIARTLIIEDSVVGVTGAVASGAQVVGLAVGRHCRDGHGEKLRAVGATRIVHDFDAIATLFD